MKLGLGHSLSGGRVSGGGAPSSSGFIFTVKTDNTGVSANDEFKIPLVSNGAIDLVVDWGDSSSDVITAWNDAALTHTFAAAGTYTIEITATTGTLRGWTFGWSGDKVKMTDISQWGDFNWTNSSAFTQCANMTCTATDVPNITGNSMQYGFYGCTLWNPDTAGSWDVSSCTNLNSIFIFNSSFNQDIDAWDVSNVTDFGGMFYGTAFNYPLPNWDTGSGTSFNQMFFDCSAFNQDIDMWDMSSALSLYAMFYNCTAFNQDLNSWNTSSVTSMSSVFTGCTVFDGDISSWNVSSCTNFGNAFQATAFNQDITGWNVSSGTSFAYMFRAATSFDQDISGWNVANATNMTNMLRDATAFNQNLSSWDISSVSNLGSFLRNVTLSTANYDALLIGWDAQAVVSGLTPNFGNSTYTGGGAAATARANLIASDSWTITDGGIA